MSHEIETLNETVTQLQDSIGNWMKLIKSSFSPQKFKLWFIPFQYLDEQKELRESKKNSQDDNIDLLKEESGKQKQFADDANNFKNECEARLQEILKAVERLYK